MNVTAIKRMWWANEPHTSVGLIADVENDGDNLTIHTPYSDESIIWGAVQAFPTDQIEEYTPPVADDGIIDVIPH